MKIFAVLSTLTACLFTACTTTYKADPKKTAIIRSAITPVDTLIEKQREGTDFFAKGDQPVAWTLAVDLEKDFRFKSADEELLIAPAVSPIALQEKNSMEYITKTDAGEMKVIIYKDACAPADGKDHRSSRVEVTVNNKRYTGCGAWLYDFRLNNIWTLAYIDNTIVEKTNDNKLPWLEFNLQKNKLYGYDGCSSISSNITVQGNRIKIDPFNAITKACLTNETGKLFYEMLSGKLVDYAIKDEKLYLYLINDSKLIFENSGQPR